MAKSKKDFSNQAQGMGYNAWFQKTDQEEDKKAKEIPVNKKKSSVELKGADSAEVITAAPVRKNRPKKSKPVEKPASERGCKDGDTRKTFIIKKDLAEKIQDVAYWEPGKLKDHVNAALEAYVKKKWSKKRPKGA